MAFNLLTKEQMLELRAGTLMRDLEKTDRILSGKDVRVTFVPTNTRGVSSVAWTQPQFGDRYEVNLTDKAVGDLSDIESIIGVTGANYHELSHVLYTYPNGPSTPSYIIDRVERIMTRRGDLVNEQQVRWAWNLLEDQRIERQFIRKYAATKHYFVALVNKFLLDRINEPGTRESIFPLIASRRYVDKDVRETLRQAYVDGIKGSLKYDGVTNTAVAEGLSLELAKAVEAYASVEEFDSYDNAAAMVVTFFDLLMQAGNKSARDVMQQDSPFHQNTPGTVHSNSANSTPRLNWSNQQDDDEDEAGDDDSGSASDDSEGTDGDDSQSGNGEAAATDDGDDEEEGASGSGGDSADDEADSSGNGAMDGSESGEDAAEASAGDEDEESEDTTDDGSGVGTGSSGMSYNDASEKLWEDYKGSIGNSVVQADASRRMAIVRSNRNLGARTLSERPGMQERHNRIVPALQTRGVANRMTNEFKRIVADNDPGRLTHKSSGMVSMKRAMAGEFDPDTAFDQWDEGNINTASIEVVLLIDASGSMSGVADKVSESFWAFKRALEQASSEITVSVICFSDNAFYLEAPGTKAQINSGPRLPTINGTQPLEGLEEARRIFGTTQKKKGLLLCFTDGIWSNAEECNEVVEQITASGVVTGLAFYSQFWELFLTTSNVDVVPLTKQNYFAAIPKVGGADQLFRFGAAGLTASERARLERKLISGTLTEQEKNMVWDEGIMHKFQISSGLSSPSDFTNFAKAIAETLIAANTN